MTRVISKAMSSHARSKGPYRDEAVRRCFSSRFLQLRACEEGLSGEERAHNDQPDNCDAAQQ